MAHARIAWGVSARSWALMASSWAWLRGRLRVEPHGVRQRLRAQYPHFQYGIVRSVSTDFLIWNISVILAQQCPPRFPTNLSASAFTSTLESTSEKSQLATVPPRRFIGLDDHRANVPTIITNSLWNSSADSSPNVRLRSYTRLSSI